MILTQPASFVRRISNCQLNAVLKLATLCFLGASPVTTASELDQSPTAAVISEAIKWADDVDVALTNLSFLAVDESADESEDMAQSAEPVVPPNEVHSIQSTFKDCVVGRPINALTTNIDTMGEIPESAAKPIFAAFPPRTAPTEFAPNELWFAYGDPKLGLCYRPLYFEQPALERYGTTHGIFQPVISAAHFFGTIPLMPYKLTLCCPQRVECSYLPNGCSRGRVCRCQHRRADFRAKLVQAGWIVGLVFAIP